MNYFNPEVEKMSLAEVQFKIHDVRDAIHEANGIIHPMIDQMITDLSRRAKELGGTAEIEWDSTLGKHVVRI